MFVEVVATAGLVSEAQQTALMTIVKEGGFCEEQVAFVTAYADRDDSAFKGSVTELAWCSFAWFMLEPEHIVVMQRGVDVPQLQLSDLMKLNKVQ